MTALATFSTSHTESTVLTRTSVIVGTFLLSFPNPAVLPSHSTRNRSNTAYFVPHYRHNSLYYRGFTAVRITASLSTHNQI